MSSKISIQKVNQMIGKQPVEIFTIGEKRVIYNPNISLSKLSSISDKVIEGVFSKDGKYFPEIEEIIKFYFIIKEMTNLPVKTQKDDSIDIEYMHSLISSSVGLSLKEKLYLDSTYQLLTRIIDEKIKLRLKLLILEKSSPINKAIENFNSLIYETKDIINLVSENQKKYGSLVSENTMSKLLDSIESMKSGEGNLLVSLLNPESKEQS